MRGVSLRAKVFVLFAGAALLVVVPALLLIADAVEGGVYRRATEDLARADSAVEENWTDRDPLLRAATQARVLLPEVARAWPAAGADTTRFRRLLRRDLDKEVAIAVDSLGERIVGPRLRRSTLDALARAETAQVVVGIPEEGGPPLRLVMQKIARNDTIPLGMVGVGASLSAAVLRKGLPAGTEVALAVGDSMIDDTFADSAKGEVRGIDVRELRAGARGAPVRRTTAGQPYLISVHEASTPGLRTSVLLFRPVADELRVATGIKQSLFGIGFAALVLALVLAAVVARIVARPAQTLALASQRLARGDYAAPLPRASGDEIGQLARAFGEMRTAIGEREQRLRSAQAEMIHREKLAAMGRLVAQLSHEINNPIYNIQNCLEALERRGDPRDPNREFLSLAQEELRRMAALTRQLLDQSRPLADHAAPTDLNALVRRVTTLAGPELGARGVRMETALDTALPRVTVHPDAIQQVLANLVTNAGDAMPGGGRLRVVTRTDADAVEVVVEDTGTGISDEALPHIFEAFYTTKPGVTGLGLGLFVSEGIVRGHRGRIVVESRRGEGSRFTVRLPRETLDEALSDADPPAMDAAAD